MLILSISLLTKIFDKFPDCENWSLQLLRINNSKKNGISYATRQIELTPNNKLHDYVWNISKRYTKGRDSFSETFINVIDYDGSTIGNVIYKLNFENILISEALNKLLAAISDPDVEANPLEFSPQAYIVKGNIMVDEKEINVKLISMNKPLTTLRNKYILKIYKTSQFEEITDQVLSLRNAFDVIIIDNNIYFLTLAAEKLFNLEHTYRKICEEKVNLICDKNLISDNDNFKKIASSGHNPRKFISFNDKGLSFLENETILTDLAPKFSLIIKNGKIDTSDEKTSQNLIKLLCRKGMEDPFEHIAVEVESAKTWN